MRAGARGISSGEYPLGQFPPGPFPPREFPPREFLPFQIPTGWIPLVNSHLVNSHMVNSHPMILQPMNFTLEIYFPLKKIDKIYKITEIISIYNCVFFLKMEAFNYFESAHFRFHWMEILLMRINPVGTGQGGISRRTFLEPTENNLKKK